MASQTKVSTQVLPGGRITVTDDAWQVGAQAEVVVTIIGDGRTQRPSLIEVLAQAPGRLAFRSAEEVDAYLHAERSAWES